MRLFIHNVDTYLGKVLVKELRKAERGFHRIFGTVADSPEKAPSVVKRIVSHEDPKKAKKMAETIQTCKLVVIDLFNCTEEDLHFAISCLNVDPKTRKPTGELEGEIIFVLISSVMVWADTPEWDGYDGSPLRESDYQHRAPIPGSKYEQWRDMENLVMECFNQEGSMVKCFIVAGGALYGEGEETFGELFRDAWRGVQEHVIIAPGTNRIPTVHVRDLVRLVRHLGYHSEGISPKETPYFLAIDQPPAVDGERAQHPTQTEIVQGIIDEVCEHYPVAPIQLPSNGDENMAIELKDFRQTMTVNLEMETSKLMLDPEFASQIEPPGWWCQEGFLSNIRKIADEFCKERGLRAMRVLIGGPPASGKSSLAAAVAEHFKIPHLELRDEDLDVMASRLSSKVCRYRGYVLDAGSAGFTEVDKLFCRKVIPPAIDAESGEPPAEGDEPQPVEEVLAIDEQLCPTFVIVTQAPEALCRARWQSRGTGTIDLFKDNMKEYIDVNLSDDPSLIDFFQEKAQISVLNLPVAGKDEDDLFESTRIYMESAGRPFNYLPLENEVNAETMNKHMEKEQAAAESAAAEAKRQAMGETEQRDDEERQADRMRIIAMHEAEQQSLGELPLREYLMKYMVPSLTEGLIEICKVLPENPVDYLATYLENHASDGCTENV